MSFLHQGAPFTYGLLCFSLLTHPFAIAALGVAFFGRKRGASIGLGAATLLLAGVALALGVFGYMYGMYRVDAAVAYASPDQVESLRAYGRSEAMTSVWCALASAAIPALGGGLALGRGLTLAPPEP